MFEKSGTISSNTQCSHRTDEKSGEEKRKKRWKGRDERKIHIRNYAFTKIFAFSSTKFHKLRSPEKNPICIWTITCFFLSRSLLLLHSFLFPKVYCHFKYTSTLFALCMTIVCNYRNATENILLPLIVSQQHQKYARNCVCFCYNIHKL